MTSPNPQTLTENSATKIADFDASIPVAVSESDEKGCQQLRQELVTQGLTAKNSGEIAELTGNGLQYRHNEHEVYPVEILKFDLARNRIRVRVTNGIKPFVSHGFFAATYAEDTAWVSAARVFIDREWQEQLELAHRIAENCKEQMLEFKGLVVWGRTDPDDAMRFFEEEMRYDGSSAQAALDAFHQILEQEELERDQQVADIELDEDGLPSREKQWGWSDDVAVYVESLEIARQERLESADKELAEEMRTMASARELQEWLDLEELGESPIATQTAAAYGQADLSQGSTPEWFDGIKEIPF